ncbi:MAG: hypothetical protein IPP21_19995 [Betaproteobacteria bacterium]|nr:hypothetical protein [Betaproteobacteria bacterium]
MAFALLLAGMCGLLVAFAGVFILRAALAAAGQSECHQQGGSRQACPQAAVLSLVRVFIVQFLPATSRPRFRVRFG